MFMRLDVTFPRWRATIWGLVFISLLSYGGESSQLGWTLDRIIKRAVEQTPVLKALDQDIVSFYNKAKQAGKWDNPEAILSGGPMISTPNGHSIDVGIAQKVPLFGQKNIEEQLGLQVTQLAQADREIGNLQVRQKVIQLTYGLAATLEQSKHISHRRERIELISKFLSSRPFASPSQWVEKNLVQNRLREVQEKVLDISAEKGKVWNDLNVFLNLDTQIVPDVKWFLDPKEPNYDDLLKGLLRKNPELLRQQQVVSYADLNIEQAGKKVYPDLQFGLAFNEQTAGVAQRIYSGSIQLSLPIVDRGGYAKQAFQAQKEAESHRLEQKRRILLSYFAQARNDLSKSRKRIELYPLSLISDLEDKMDRAEKEWKKGLVPVVAFLELENQVHEQTVKVFGSQMEYVNAMSQILALAGMSFSE